MPEQRPHDTNFLHRAKGGPQQTHRVQELQSDTSARRPGTFFTWRVLTKQTSKPRSSRIWNSGIRRVGGGGAQVAPVLATVRRSNVVCGFSAPRFKESGSPVASTHTCRTSCVSAAVSSRGWPATVPILHHGPTLNQEDPMADAMRVGQRFPLRYFG